MNSNRKTYLSISYIGTLQFIQKVLALLKQMLIAPFFGASNVTDAWFVAYAIPEMLINFLGFNTMKSAITSFFTHMQHDNPDEINENFSSLFNLVLIFGLFFSITSVVLAPYLTRLMASELPNSELILATKLSRIVLPVIVLMGISNYMMSVLNSFHMYSAPAISQITMNLIVILILILLHKSIGIYSLAWGFLMGCFGAILIQIPFLIKSKIKYKIFSPIFTPATRKFLTFFSPLFFPILFGQIGLIVQKNLASSLRPLGKITALSYAQLVIGSIIFLFVQPLLIIWLPKLSGLSASQKNIELNQTISRNINLFLFIFTPLSIFVYLFSYEITLVLFKRGNFDFYATEITASSIEALSISIVFWALTLLMSQTLISMKNTRVVASIESFTVVINIILYFVLTKYFDLYGLVFSISLTFLLRFLFYLVFYKYSGFFIFNEKSLFKTMLYLIITVIVGLLMNLHISETGNNYSTVSLIIKLLASFVIIFVLNSIVFLYANKDYNVAKIFNKG